MKFSSLCLTFWFVNDYRNSNLPRIYCSLLRQFVSRRNYITYRFGFHI
jgi:hypothetical protein